MKGRRLPDTAWGSLPPDMQPGDYWKILDREGDEPMKPIGNYPGNLTQTVWQYYSPDGNGVGTLMAHTVRENDDGTITVAPGDGSSNSILHSGARDTSWHGYIDHGVWTTA